MTVLFGFWNETATWDPFFLQDNALNLTDRVSGTCNEGMFPVGIAGIANLIVYFNGIRAAIHNPVLEVAAVALGTLIGLINRHQAVVISGVLTVGVDKRHQTAKPEGWRYHVPISFTVGSHGCQSRHLPPPPVPHGQRNSLRSDHTPAEHGNIVGVTAVLDQIMSRLGMSWLCL